MLNAEETIRMSSTILVPLDGSVLAEQALSLAGQLGRAAAAGLVLTRVIADDSRQDDADAQNYLRYAAGRLTYSEVPVETVVAQGDAATEILRIARQRQAELIVISTHGHSGPGRWLYGSVADEVLRGADIPVVLLPPAALPELADKRPLRILVPLDGSRLAESVFATACVWAQRLEAELILLQVVLWPPYVSSDAAKLLVLDPDAMVATAEQYLDEVARRYRSETIQVRRRAVLGRPVPSTIARVASEEAVDLVAMATHGRSGLARLVLGSVATGTLQRTDVPMLVVRPPTLGKDDAESVAGNARSTPS
jgi:nucleotide-binding universal stress UspA family protein